MTREEFKKSIKVVLKHLVTFNVYEEKHWYSSEHSWYVCDVLKYHVSYEAAETYSDLLYPTENSFAFFGDGTEENLKDRQTSLLIFEQNCLLYKTYERF